MTHIDPARKSRLMEIFAVEGLPLFVPLATPDDELTPASTVELLEEGIYEDVRSSSKVTLATSRASWIDAESRRPVIGKVTVNYVPSRLRLLRSAFNLALLTFRNRSCTVQTLAAVLFGALATLLAPDELKVVVVAQVDGIDDKGEVSKRFVEGGAHVFDAEEELTRVVLSIDVPRHIGELQRRGAPAPHMITSALDTLKRILEDRSWRHASDQREALAYSLAVAAFQTGGSRAFGLDFYAGDGVEVEESTTIEGAQTDVEEWLEKVIQGEATEDLRVTYKTGEEAPLSVERVAVAPSAALVEASALDELEALGAAELSAEEIEELSAEELAALEGVDLRAVLEEEAGGSSPAAPGEASREGDALPYLRVWEILRAAGLRCGFLTGSSRWEILVDKLGSHVVGQYAMGYPGLTVELKWLEPWGEEHSRTYPDGATEADVVAWLEPWVERQQREAARPSPDLEEEAGEEARLEASRGPAYDGNHAAELEEVERIEEMVAALRGLDYVLTPNDARTDRCADGYEHWDVVGADDAIITRLCRESARWWTLEGQLREPTTPDDLHALLVRRIMEAPELEEAAPAPEACEAAEEIPWVSRSGEASNTAPPKLTPTVQLPPALRRGGGTIVRLVESYGFRLEESAADPGALKVHPKRKGSKAVGQIGFDGDGMLIELAWEADWSHLQFLLLAGVSADQLESWLVVGQAAYAGRSK